MEISCLDNVQMIGSIVRAICMHGHCCALGARECDIRAKLLGTLSRERLIFHQRRAYLHTPRSVRSVQVCSELAGSQRIAGKGTQKICASAMSQMTILSRVLCHVAVKHAP